MQPHRADSSIYGLKDRAHGIGSRRSRAVMRDVCGTMHVVDVCAHRSWWTHLPQRWTGRDACPCVSGRMRAGHVSRDVMAFVPCTMCDDARHDDRALVFFMERADQDASLPTSRCSLIGRIPLKDRVHGIGSRRSRAVMRDVCGTMHVVDVRAHRSWWTHLPQRWTGRDACPCVHGARRSGCVAAALCVFAAAANATGLCNLSSLQLGRYAIERRSLRMIIGIRVVPTRRERWRHA
jgi:ferredoxin-thioredoxin reductase catalytic subunit